MGIFGINEDGSLTGSGMQVVFRRCRYERHRGKLAGARASCGTACSLFFNLRRYLNDGCNIIEIGAFG